MAPQAHRRFPRLIDSFVSGTVAAVPDLTITKSHTGNFAQGQTGATYTITVTNSGGAATSGTVTVTDTLPTGLTATAISGTGWTCTQPAGSCTRSDVLAAAASYPALTLTVNVASNAPATVTNTATVAGGGETNTSNDTASDATTVGDCCDAGSDDHQVAHREFRAGSNGSDLQHYSNELRRRGHQRDGHCDGHGAYGLDGHRDLRDRVDMYATGRDRVRAAMRLRPRPVIRR